MQMPPLQGGALTCMNAPLAADDQHYCEMAASHAGAVCCWVGLAQELVAEVQQHDLLRVGDAPEVRLLLCVGASGGHQDRRAGVGGRVPQLTSVAEHEAIPAGLDALKDVAQEVRCLADIKIGDKWYKAARDQVLSERVNSSARQYETKEVDTDSDLH